MAPYASSIRPHTEHYLSLSERAPQLEFHRMKPVNMDDRLNITGEFKLDESQTG